MNYIERSGLSASAERRAALARKRRRLLIAIGVAAVVLAAIAYYVWATTLCGDCGAPAVMPPSG